MTNKEWLDYLAHNAPDELAAWFDAEHVEHQDGTLDGDTEPENEDSRELILTDLEKKTREWHDYDGNYMRIYSGVAYAQMKELLDRQAAITEEQTRCKWVTASADEIAAWRSKAEKLKEQVYELTAERDEIAELVGWHGEADGNSGRLLLVPMVAAMCDGSDVAAKLQEQVDELKAERVKLRSQICKLEDDLVRTSDERDNWKANCEDWKKDCERYRSKFGKCIDCADAIHALMDDEGLA